MRRRRPRFRRRELCERLDLGALVGTFGSKARSVIARFSSCASAFVFCDEECAELLRIEQGIPRWGRELTDQIIPTEANLEATSIDYAKGCYIGQEVISRIKMSGQTNKRLCGLVSLSGTPLRPGMRLAAAGDEGKEAGWITSAVRSPRLEKEIALGYVKRGFNAAGSRLHALPPENSATRLVSRSNWWRSRFFEHLKQWPASALSTSPRPIPTRMGGTSARVSDLNLEIQDREFVVLLGPPNCGISSVVRMIAGLEEISKGDIFIGDRRVNDLAPKDRDIALVPQSYVPYPRMSVY